MDEKRFALHVCVMFLQTRYDFVVTCPSFWNSGRLNTHFFREKDLVWCIQICLIVPFTGVTTLGAFASEA